MNNMHDQPPLNPEELANQLDAWLESGTLPETPDPLIETAARLHQAPRPTLDAAAFARTQQRVLDAAPPANAAAALAQGQRLAQLAGITFVGIILALLLALVVWAAQVMTPDADTSTSEATPAAEFTLDSETVTTEEALAFATSTSTPSQTSTKTAPPSPTPTVTDTHTATTTATATATFTDTATRTASPTATHTATQTPSFTASPMPELIVTASLLKPPVASGGSAGTGSSGSNATLGSGDTSGNAGGTSTTGGTTDGTQPDIIAPSTVDWDNQPCDNPPPPWAVANGWHRRCGGETGGTNPGGNNGSGNGNGSGGGNNGGNNGNGNNGGGNGGGSGKK